MDSIRKTSLFMLLACMLVIAAGCDRSHDANEGANDSAAGTIAASPQATDTPSSPSPTEIADATAAPSAPESTPATASPSSTESTDSTTFPNSEESAAPTASPIPPGTAAPTAAPHAGDASSAPQQSAKLGKVTAVRLIDPASGWTGGNGWIARTDNSGKDWTLQYQGTQTIRQIFALNGQEAWAALDADSGGAGDGNADNGGADSGGTGGGQLLHTTDGGGHWSPVGSLPNRDFLHFVSPREAFAGNAHTTDGGKTWTELPVPADIAGSAYFHDQAHGWVALQGDRKLLIQRTMDGGKTWKTVMSRDTTAALTNAVIRSAGTNDAWVECLGDSGMSHTGFSLFHTEDGGDHWTPVINNDSAGAGPGPGFPMNDDKDDTPSLKAAAPGMLYVVNTKVAFMSGYCAPCDNAVNSIGWTTDGGKTWTNGEAAYPGYAGSLLAIADAKHGWWICTDNADPSVMYTTADGGIHWQKAHAFDVPDPQ